MWCFLNQVQSWSGLFGHTHTHTDSKSHLRHGIGGKTSRALRLWGSPKAKPKAKSSLAPPARPKADLQFREGWQRSVGWQNDLASKAVVIALVWWQMHLIVGSDLSKLSPRRADCFTSIVRPELGRFMQKWARRLSFAYRHLACARSCICGTRVWPLDCDNVLHALGRCLRVKKRYFSEAFWPLFL